MKTGRIVLFLMVLSVLWCADAFAHMLPDDQHFCPGTTKDPCEGKGCDVSSDYDGGHGHIDSFYSKNDLTRTPITDPTVMYNSNLHGASSWGYWHARGYAAVSEKSGGGLNLGCGGGNGGNGVFSIVVISGPGSGAPGNPQGRNGKGKQ